MFIFHHASCGACGHKLSPTFSKVIEVGEVWYERTEHRCTNHRCSKDTSVIIEGRKPMSVAHRQAREANDHANQWLNALIDNVANRRSASTRPGRWAKIIQCWRAKTRG